MPFPEAFAAAHGDETLSPKGTPRGQKELPQHLDFPTRPQAAMNAVSQTGDPEIARRAFEVLRRSAD